MKRSGFSLVELSIVLVILGLLVGGILAGQSLIRAAELRSVTTESQRFVTVINAFRDKYFAVPGDINTATSFWGKDSTYCNGDSGIANATTGTCNGNGDGILDNPAAASSTGEVFQFWRQLALAGLIEGTYSGIAGAGSVVDATLGTNVPRARLTNGGWTVIAGTSVVAAQMYSGPTYGNYMTLGAKAANSGTGNALLKPEEAWNIDTKMDDGRPAYGRVIAKFWNDACGTAISGGTSQTNLNAQYRLNDNTAQCALHFTRIF